MSKHKDGDLITFLHPHDPEEFYDIAEEEKAKFIGIVTLKYIEMLDSPSKPGKFVLLDVSEDKEK